LLRLLAAGSVILAGFEMLRVLRFRKCIRVIEAPPAFLEKLAREMAAELRVVVPRLSIVTGVASPMLWCLGTPRLLVPRALLGELGVEHWKGILAHEFAHLRRGDQWVSRLQVLASLLWWWNPVFWWVRARLEAEAELACDAWVVWAFPEGRRSYATALVDVCEIVSLVKPPTPALGIVSGAGHLIERRLAMILNDRVPCRLSLGGFLAASALAFLALPSWTRAQSGDPARGEAQSLAVVTATPGDDDDDREKGSDVEAKVRAELAQERQEQEIERAKAEVARLSETLKTQQREMEQQVRKAEAELRAAQARLRAQINASQARLRVAEKKLSSMSKLEGAEAEKKLAEALTRAKVSRLDRRVAVESKTRGPRPPESDTAPSQGENRGGSLEKRVQVLEKKLDAILGEIRAMRRDRERPRDDEAHAPPRRP
jgi:hypothetical protein